MRYFLALLFFVNFLGAQEGEGNIPHPADSFCKALGVDVYQLKLGQNEANTIFHVAQQYIKAHSMMIQNDMAGDTFWITVETLLAGVNPKKSYELIKLISEIEDGKNKEQPRNLGNELLTLKFATGKLQKGSNNDKRYAWMLAYALNQISLTLKPEASKDFNVLFAMVDQNVHGMSFRSVQQKKFIPSILTAKTVKGTPPAAGKPLEIDKNFLTQNKGTLISSASIKQLYTITDDDGNDTIKVETLKSRVLPGKSHRSTSFDFEIGLSLMANVSFGEVVSLLSTRYPYLEPYKEVLFSVPEDINADSSSSGLGLSLLLMSHYEGIDIDPDIISCADISVNGKVLPAYDMTEKIKKAGSTANGIVIMSVQDYQALLDAFVIWGHSALWSCQVIAARDISEAIDIARKDRSEKHNAAIEEFKKIQLLLRRNPNNLLPNRQKINAQLVTVLNNLPTHASARALHNILNGKVPRELSLNTSLDLFSKTCKPILKEMFEDAKTSASSRNACKNRLQRISKALNKSMEPLIEAMNVYINEANASAPNDDNKKSFLREWVNLTKNRKFVDRLR